MHASATPSMPGHPLVSIGPRKLGSNDLRVGSLILGWVLMLLLTDLLHPGFIRMMGDSRDRHPSALEVNEK